MHSYSLQPTWDNFISAHNEGQLLPITPSSVLDHPMTVHVFLAYVTLALSFHLRTEGEVSYGKIFMAFSMAFHGIPWLSMAFSTGRFSYSFVLHLPTHMAKNPIPVNVLSINVQFFLFQVPFYHLQQKGHFYYIFLNVTSQSKADEENYLEISYSLITSCSLALKLFHLIASNTLKMFNNSFAGNTDLCGCQFVDAGLK